MDLFLQIYDICIKNEIFYCSLFYYEQKPLSVLWDSFSFARHLYFKNMCQTGKFWDPKIRARRWIWLSHYVTPIGKMREVISLWHIRHKILFPFLKMILQSPRIIIWKWWLSIVKTPHSWKCRLILQGTFDCLPEL